MDVMQTSHDAAESTMHESFSARWYNFVGCRADVFARLR